MKRETYNLIYRAAALQDFDYNGLQTAQLVERDPFIQRRIYSLLHNVPLYTRWNHVPFQSEEFFKRSAGERLDQVVFTFLLRVAALAKKEMFSRSFYKPESFDVVLAHSIFLKECVFCTTTLLYNVRWSTDRFLALDQLVLRLAHEGSANALREFLTKDMGIVLSIGNELTDAEKLFAGMSDLNIFEYGSSMWRLLHWMAEAVDVRKDDENPDVAIAKREWRQLVLGPLYRILECRICMNHISSVFSQLKDKLQDETASYGRLWYEIHNKVTAIKNKTVQVSDPRQLGDLQYSWENYQRDREFMHRVLDQNTN